MHIVQCIPGCAGQRAPLSVLVRFPPHACELEEGPLEVRRGWETKHLLFEEQTFVIQYLVAFLGCCSACWVMLSGDIAAIRE